MNAILRQTERLGRLTTKLGPDLLVLLRFDGTEHLNDLFEYRVEALATRNDLDFDALVGTHATVEIEGREGIRHFDGIVTQARWAGVGENGHRYDLTLRPWFWIASRRRNQRIFHNKTVVQILEELLSDYAGLGSPALEVKLGRDYPVLEYTVQYRESDLAFARRQMERHGISFHFRHAMGSHTLTLSDDMISHESIGVRPFKPHDAHHQAEEEHFWEWSPERNITTGAIRLTDYNFKQPNQAMEVDRLGGASHEQGQIESFDYPGDYLAQDVGKLVAGLRTEQERGGDRRNRAIGDCVSLGAGHLVTLTGDPVPGRGETYLCLSASYTFISEAYGSGSQQSDGYSFTGSYTLMPDTAPMAPPRRTHVPVVQGPQTAMVVGEGEIDCDEYGRILVRFHWDLDDAYSMRCRVSQNWAGNGWGGMVIPRIGMEVVVEFLEGDPDKPLVTGCVYNGKNKVPYDLPEHKTKSVFRTDTHKGQGFNEIRFEDEFDHEEIYFHAQKDMNGRVNNDRAIEVGNNQSNWVGANHSVEVGKNQSTVVSGSMRLAVGVASSDLSPENAIKKIMLKLSPQSSGIARAVRNMTRSLKTFAGVGNLSILVNGNKIENITKVAIENVGVSKSSAVLGARTEITGSMSHVQVGSHKTEEVGGILSQKANEGWQVSSGTSHIYIDPKGEILITASMIKFMANNIDIAATDAIKMTARKVEING